MRIHVSIFVGAFVLATAVAGCSLVAGVQDIAYAEDAGTGPSPNASVSGQVAGGSAPANGDDAPARPASSAPPAPSSPDDAGAPSARDAAVDAEDAAVPAPVNPAPVVDGAAACSAVEFAIGDRRGAGDARKITLVGLAGVVAQYEPRCMVITAGQSVTFAGDFVTNPLAARSQAPVSPITPVAAGSSATFTFTVAGQYHYGSTANAALGGTIDVRP